MLLMTDIQIYTACRTDSVHQTDSLSSRVNELNFLSLNLSKTEILFTVPSTLSKNITSDPCFDPDATSVFPSATVRNLGKL